MAGAKTLHVAAYYRPHEGAEASLTELDNSLSRLSPTHSVVIGGDFNLLGWNWKDMQVNKCRHPALHHKFGSIIDDHGLSQIVTDPTRGQNILDLVLVSNPTVVSNVAIVPGVSDHDCPLVTLDIKPSRQHQKRRKIVLYNKADWEKFAELMEAVGEEILTKLPTSSVNELWLIFKSGVEKGIEHDLFLRRQLPRKTNCPGSLAASGDS